MHSRPCDRLRLDDRAVAPEGSLNARLYLIGEAPGRQEAETGRPFVGPVGAALRDMMREAGIDVSRVRLANAIPFRPIERSPGGRVRNRRPTDKELRIYGQSVLVDIVKVQPKLIAALGRSAATLFGASIPVRRSRTSTLQFQNMPVRFTYHPGFVVRFGGRGSPLWRSAVRDLKKFWNEAQQRRSTHTGGRSAEWR
jgi:uracil-DNA glycosylase